MASACKSNCINDVIVRPPIRATYVNLYKWPESDAEFVRSVSSAGSRRADASSGHPRVVDSISCRQLYLRSYTFSRKESVPEKTRKCLGRVREKVVLYRTERKSRGSDSVARRAKEVSCAALSAVFRRLLSCTTKVDVVD
ncbi:uncharacterized protein LOC130766475 isoform X2 [Actinidia eriantha]|uniref:uncharacterized protein LOC130766475 isoform X2 n=2 Tax=Actinidia eriantha TaxID=165200 RepID=UPI002585C16F|nr:uncharacterized protein LOC130766475 isoform X2 [Actinidia eriantha]